MVLATLLMSMTVLAIRIAFTMMLVSGVVLTPETVMPILSQLFKKNQQLLLFLIGETFKQSMVCILGAACLCLSFAGIGQCNIHGPSIFTVGLAGDQSCRFQLLDDLTGGARLYA